MYITTTKHAIERYRERVRPELSHSEARAALDRTIDGLEPESCEPWPGCTHRENDMWLRVHDGDVALPVEYDRSGRAFAVTCLIKGGDPNG